LFDNEIAILFKVLHGSSTELELRIKKHYSLTIHIPTNVTTRALVSIACPYQEPQMFCN